jgi:hypothetical protein
LLLIFVIFNTTSKFSHLIIISPNSYRRSLFEPTDSGCHLFVNVKSHSSYQIYAKDIIISSDVKSHIYFRIFMFYQTQWSKHVHWLHDQILWLLDWFDEYFIHKTWLTFWKSVSKHEFVTY